VFSPAYAAARARGPASPLHFCAVNVALHGPGADAWVMHEGLSPTRERDLLALGESTMRVTPDGLDIELNVPRTRFFGRADTRAVKGRIRLTGLVIDGDPVALAPGQRWSPVCPKARVSVDLQDPALRFEGTAYHDANTGDAPLERAFERWQWLRWSTPDAASVRYAGERADGGRFDHGLTWDAAGRRTALPDVEWHRAARPLWGVPRALPADLGERPHLRTLLDAPFYNRTLVTAGDARAMHESVDLARFRRPFTQYLLGFKTSRGGERP
jgi:carotenoid 1,2-hydratase